jgi:hypothetical protein
MNDGVSIIHSTTKNTKRHLLRNDRQKSNLRENAAEVGETRAVPEQRRVAAAPSNARVLRRFALALDLFCVLCD